MSTYVLETTDVALKTTPFLRAVDPRWRIVAVTIFAVLVVSLHDLVALTAAFAIAFAAMFHVKLQALPTLKMMVAMDTFMIFLILFLIAAVFGVVRGRRPKL